MPNLKRLLVLALFLLANPLTAQDRTLYWDDIAVTARLDARGTLHVRERQTTVFTGDWNGGERSFNVGLSQDLDLKRIVRIDASGREIPLVEGDLDQVDHYDWEGYTLRWRSRLPTDPPFQETPITYLLEYEYSGILSRDGDTYLLDHNFALPDVQWPIRRFSLDLELDPAWQPLAPVPAHLEERDLAPGTHVVVRNELRHTGGGEAPVPGISLVPFSWRAALFLASLLAMLYLYFQFWDGEAKRGRFEPLPLPREWDEEWLRKNVFDLRPEEVGALWDQEVGPAEVAALLARLVAEGKMTSEVRPGFTLFGMALGSSVLHLRLKVARDEFRGYERKLIDKLFFDGDDSTDTERVRQRYRSSGFNPAKTIEDGLRDRLAGHGEIGKMKPDRRRTLYLALAALGLLAVDAVAHGLATVLLAGIVLFGLLWLTIFGSVAAIAWRKRTEGLRLGSLWFLGPGLLAWLWCALAVFHRELAGIESGFYPGLPGVAGLALLPLAIWSSFLNQARSRESDKTIQKRRLLGAARRLLQSELKSPSPRLRDEWLPYLLAFGLGPAVDRWFRAFAGARAVSSSVSGSSFGSGGSSGSGGFGPSTWSGGGGSFGGAGSTAAWTVAATGLASGVSAPSSSGGGGGGGGGGSSGGGGGGGW